MSRERIALCQLQRNVSSQIAVDAPARQQFGELCELAFRIGGEFLFFGASWACSRSRWLNTDTYSPAATATAPAAIAAIPARMTVACGAEAPATPKMIDDVETMPSFAPSTLARSQLSLLAMAIVRA